MSTQATSDYSSVTETWGIPASPEQLAMQYCRYRLAGDLAAGREVLEVGCGSGMGLAYLATRARRAVGIEFTPSLLEEARQHLPGIELHQGEAEKLPFPDSSFDVVAMLEMVYYVANVDKALEEARRVLRQAGTLIVCQPNPARPDFNSSPFAVRYFNARELADMFERHGFTPKIYGSFALDAASPRDKILEPIRRIAVRLHLIPRSMRGKALVKRALYGRLPRLGAVRDGVMPYEAPTELDEADWPRPPFKNLYAVGQLRSDPSTTR